MDGDSLNLMNLEVDVTSSDKIAYLAVGRVGTRPVVRIEIEPATLSFLWALAKGILANLGVKALAQWFGLEKQQSIEELLRELILEIADVVRAEIESAEIQRAASEMQGVSLLLREYMNSPETSRFRLETAVTSSAPLVKRLENLLPVSANAYVFAVLVRLAAVQEVANLTQSRMERENVRQFAAESVPKLHVAWDALVLQNDARVSGVTTRVVSRRGREGEPGFREEQALYTVDGVSRIFVDSDNNQPRNVGVANAQRLIDLERVRADFMSKVGLSLSQSIKDVEKISEMHS